MFKRIYFYFDENGKFLGDPRFGGKSEPRILLASHCNATHFEVYTCTKRSGSGDVPALHVTRNYGNVKRDPYNEDGRPPTTMFIISLAYVSLCSGVLEAEGFEEPNLCRAGLLVPPYANCKPRKGATYMPPEMKDYTRPYNALTRQRIEMRP